MNPLAILNYLLGATEGLVMYSIYLDYANKLQEVGTGKGFDIDKDDGYVPKSYNTITDFTGLEYDTVRRCVDRLIKKGLLQKKPGNEKNKNIPYYLPEFKSSVFIKIAEEKLADKRNARDEKNKNQAERLIPQIIETLEKDQSIFGALGLVKSSQEPKSSQEQDLNVIVEYFKGYYNDIYNKDYNPSDFEIKKLQEIINNYSMDQWVGMIPIFIERYNECWKSSKYLKPTIFGLTQDWLLKQVYDIYEEEKDLNTIVKYFKFWYEKIYNKDYNSNDNEIKRLQKIINNYSTEQWGEMIPIFIERYNERWKSSKYPEPTIFGLTQDWLLKQVYDDMYEQEVKYEEYEEEEEERQRQLRRWVKWEETSRT